MLASKKANISQLLLSQLIYNFEKSKEIELLYRQNGRLKGLKHRNQRYYGNNLQTTKLHNLLLGGEQYLATIIDLTYISKEKYEEFTLITDEICAFMSENYSFSTKKGWCEIELYPFATCTKKFFIS